MNDTLDYASYLEGFTDGTDAVLTAAVVLALFLFGILVGLEMRKPNKRQRRVLRIALDAALDAEAYTAEDMRKDAMELRYGRTLRGDED